MELNGRLIPQGGPEIPPEDPPESKVPDKASETGNAANGGNANNGAGNHWSAAFSDEKAAAYIKKYGLKAYLMWLMLHGVPIGQDQ